ncbi:DUF1460 domain-containing protein [Pseudanabaena sp. FACHB-1998]|uniref:N-acetylmuramoyl-L-alanine amidase-like domain-containing protein n=1 Tax=Pseudanabaena sp. FACHB-1998 TaxID=2692858 RepID=UPI001680E761|nr:N-acetylmuramoyl-L-alanine amidase-like domain-containing protein [Pseudanabaena sp. FACHB-1998]MBD2175470.1 DUF1460 domain-containing protein [Pseudanabaena sp. FACHB-1998]
MGKIFKPFLLGALMGISISDYFIPNVKSIEQQDRVLVTAKDKLPITQDVEQDPLQKVSSIDSSATKLEYQRLMQSLSDRQLSNPLSKLTTDQILQTVSSKFLGAKYREGLLEKSKSEQLFISLTEFDCVLFVETVLAFSRNLLSTNPSYENFGQNVETVRYQDGKLDGYCSRLHYFSEWIVDNQKRNLVQDLTSELGGIQLKKKLNFMSSNWQKYPRLRNSEANYQCILAMERKLEQDTRSQIYYIPSRKISSIYPSLKSGDIIGVVTDIQGLDTTHTGLVYLTSKGTGLIHASPSGMVKVSSDLQRYVEGVDRAIGIMVARPQLP